MKWALLSVCICGCIQNVIGQCNFSPVPVLSDGDTCMLGPVDLQNGGSIPGCGLSCLCDISHLHCCLSTSGSSCTIVDVTTTSISITESGPVANTSTRRRRSLFLNWIEKRLKSSYNQVGRLVRDKRFSETTTEMPIGCMMPTTYETTTTTTAATTTTTTTAATTTTTTTAASGKKKKSPQEKSHI